MCIEHAHRRLSNTTIKLCLFQTQYVDQTDGIKLIILEITIIVHLFHKRTMTKFRCFPYTQSCWTLSTQCSICTIASIKDGAKYTNTVKTVTVALWCLLHQQCLTSLSLHKLIQKMKLHKLLALHVGVGILLYFHIADSLAAFQTVLQNLSFLWQILLSAYDTCVTDDVKCRIVFHTAHKDWFNALITPDRDVSDIETWDIII